MPPTQTGPLERVGGGELIKRPFHMPPGCCPLRIPVLDGNSHPGSCPPLTTPLEIRSKQRDPNPKDDSLIRKETSTYEGFHSTVGALLSY